MTDLLTCSQTSQQSNEPLYGTLKPAEVWLLLEYERPFGYDAVADSEISDEVKSYLASVPNSKTLLIRQPERRQQSNKPLFYVAVSKDTSPKLYSFEIDDYEDLLTFDFASIIAGEAVEASNEKLYLVCANGRRDNCCSEYGIPVYQEMSEIAGDSVWQISHIGGHRFAATMLCMPHALCYGRITPDDARLVIESYQEERLLLPHFRGRGDYPKPAQAAEHFLRSQLQEDRLDHFPLLHIETTENGWNVQFGDVNGSTAEVQVSQSESDMSVRKSCDKEHPEPVALFSCEFVRDPA